MKAATKSVDPCGIYPGICPIYIAAKDKHSRLKQILASELNVSVREIRCNGCLSKNPFIKCHECKVRDCVIARGIEGCHACPDFPCPKIEGMTDPVGKKVILRAVPALRQMGVAKFIEEEIRHYQCPHCGYQLFMGVGRCRNCNNSVSLD